MARPLFVTPPYVWLLLAAGLLLAAREGLVRTVLGAGAVRYAEVDAIGVLWLATTPATVLAVLLPFTGVGNVAAPAAYFWAGLVTILVGFVGRLAALFTLGDTFTQHVGLRADHDLATTGPYRVVRHPAYTGAIITYVGIGMALGNWLSLGIVTVAAFVGYSYRVRVEERYLRAELPGYEAYAEETPWRLVPFVW